jgi:hypothetical protein
MSIICLPVITIISVRFTNYERNSRFHLVRSVNDAGEIKRDLKSDDGALAAAAAMHTLNCHHVIELEDD